MKKVTKNIKESNKKEFLESLNRIRIKAKNINITFKEITEIVEEVRTEKFKIKHHVNRNKTF